MFVISGLISCDVGDFGLDCSDFCDSGLCFLLIFVISDWISCDAGDFGLRVGGFGNSGLFFADFPDLGLDFL